MNGDPLYEAIGKGLAGRLDPHQFQLCAQALLRPVYPTLALMRGGDDAGMDGAVGTTEGAYPIVVTTSPKMAENLRKNLKRYRVEVGGPGLAVFATSQEVSPSRRRKLETEAKKIGVRLINIHDRLDFTDRLYRDDVWRKRLLGITGTPPALSKLPRSRRVGLSERRAFGRDAELDWLRSQPRDLLLIGQPGLGKTFLHQQLANEGRCLFLVDEDPTRLADAIRAQRPSAIVIDDAHTRIATLDMLSHLRTTLGETFAIHANCWPRSEGEVRAHMRLTSRQIRELRAIDRDTMVELFKDGGIHHPKMLFLLLGYCDGKPGLGAALLDLVKRADVDAVWSGEAVLEELIEGPQLAPTETERAVLAVLSISGDSGQTLKDVADALRLSPLQIREIVTNLASGGVIEECGTDRFQVRPSVLRGVLVKDVFFAGAKSLDIRPLLGLSVDADETAHVLMAAQQRDGAVPVAIVEPLVAVSRSVDTWQHFAFCCDAWAYLVLTKYPNRVAAAGRPLLQRFPEEALIALLEGDAGVPSRGGDFAKHRDVIASWIVGDDVGDSDTVERRRQLLAVIEPSVASSQPLPAETIGWALSQVIRSSFSKTETTPGSGRQFSMYSGTWSKGDLSQIAELWPRVVAIVRNMPIASWAAVRHEIESWTNPGAVSFKKLPAPTVAIMRSTATRMLTDVADLPNATPLLRSWVADKAEWAKLRVRISVEKDVRILYGNGRSVGDFEKREAKLSKEIQSVAKKLAQRRPDEALKELDAQEKAFRDIGGGRGGRQWRLFSELARTVTNAEEWLSAAVECDAGEDAVSSFSWRLLESDEAAALRWLRKLLTIPRYDRIGVNHALRLTRPPPELLDLALSKFSAKHYDPLQLAFLRLLPDVMLRLLTHNERDVRVLAALAEWNTEPKGEVRPGLREEWRKAVLDADDEYAYELDGVLRADPTLAYDWIDAKISTAGRKHRMSQVASAAASVISVDDRIKLIKRLANVFDDELFAALFRGDMEVFAAWLALPLDDEQKLAPLEAPRWFAVRDARPYHITDRWIAMALCALDAGVSEAMIARAARPSLLSMNGNWSTFFEEMTAEYRRLLKHTDRRLHRAGREGLAWATERRDESLRDEEEERIRGI